MNPDPKLPRLAARLRERAGDLKQFNVVVGFDGFVDEIISVVHERQRLDQWTPVKDIDTFGTLIKAAAGRSSLREIIVHRADPGGCSVNLGDGLLALGITLDCFATLGQPRHAAFEAFAGKCRTCHSWGREPGRTLAFEFSDGKLMFSAVTPLAEFDCRLLDKVLADGAYARACRQAQLIALTDWTMYPHMTECWRMLQREVYSTLKQRPFFFLDLVDPTSRSEADIRAMLEVIPGFEAFGPTVLGVNGTEANVLSRILGLPVAEEHAADVQRQAAALRQKLGISQGRHALRQAGRARRHPGNLGCDGTLLRPPQKKHRRRRSVQCRIRHRTHARLRSRGLPAPGLCRLGLFRAPGPQRQHRRIGGVHGCVGRK